MHLRRTLVENLRDYLLGIDKKPNYFFRLGNGAAATEAISKWWEKRWVAGRIDRPDILDRIRQHTLVHPITHGARVMLPDEDVEQAELFCDIR